MIFELPDGREFDSEDEADVERLALALVSAEKVIALLQSRFKTLQEAGVIPATVAADTQLIEAVNAVNQSVKSGLERVVIASLSDTVLVRDPLGEPQMARKVVNDASKE